MNQDSDLYGKHNLDRMLEEYNHYQRNHLVRAIPEVGEKFERFIGNKWSAV